MKFGKSQLVWSLTGAIGGMAGIFSAAQCGGRDCASCFGCAGVGAMALLAGFWKRKSNHRDGIDPDLKHNSSQLKEMGE